MTSIVLALALAATTVSQSKLGVEVLGDDATSRALLAAPACPRLVVVPLPLPTNVGALVAGYRAACAGGAVIVQVGGKNQAVDAATVTNLWSNTWLQQVQAAALLFTVHGVEGPSEPAPTIPGTDLASFWAAFAQAVSGSGFLPVVGALPPGVPVGSPDPFCATVTAVRATLVPFTWSYHARSPTMTQDVPTESSTTLAYRKIASDCGLTGTTLYLTEAGRVTGPWLATDSSWLTWFDARLQEDADAQGAALVEAGGGTGQPLDLAPVAPALASHLANPASADGGRPDGGADGGDGAAVNPGPGPGGPLVNSKQHLGCSCGNPGLTAVVLVPALLALRRRTRSLAKPT